MGEVISGFAAADGALITMDASRWGRGWHGTAIRLSRQTHTPAIFVITRCERENADPMAAVDARARPRAKSRRSRWPWARPTASVATWTSYTVTAWVYKDGKRQETAIPDELTAEVALRREQLLEAAADADDEVLMKFLDGEEVTDEEPNCASIRVSGTPSWRP